MQESAQYHSASKLSPVPMHYQVEQDMRKLIETGVWQAGQQLPSEMELCTLYGVSRTTLRQAISVLVDEGLIVRERGRGSFVRASMVTAGARGLTSFSDEMAALGMKAGARLLSVQEMAAPAEIARRLRIEPGAPLVVVRRVRYANEMPLGIQVAHLPAARFPGLPETLSRLNSVTATLAELGVADYTRAQTRITALAADPVLALHLNLAAGAPLLHTAAVNVDPEGTPVEYGSTFFAGERVTLTIAP